MLTQQPAETSAARFLLEKNDKNVANTTQC
jgi:hypothetical protein